MGVVLEAPLSWFTESPIPMWAFDRDTRQFVDVNEAAVAAYGWTREEFLAMTIEDIRPAEDVPRLRALLDPWPDGSSDVGIWRHLTRSGEIRHVRVLAQPGPTPSTRVVAVIDVSTSVEARRRADTLVRLSDACDQQPLDEFLEEVGRQLAAVTDSAYGALFAIAEDGAWRTLCEHRPPVTLVELDAVARSLVLELLRSLAREARPLIFNDTTSFPPLVAERYSTLSRVMAVPLVRSGTVVATAIVANKPSPYVDDDAVTLRVVADLAFHVVQRDQARAAAEQAMQNVVEVLAKATEVRDPYTSGHQQRVAVIAVEIGRELGLDAHRLRGLDVAASLHDLGKLGVPAEILVKPSTLSRYELEMVRIHAQMGHDILESVVFPWPVAEMVLQHHERLDGSGYPRGLAGEEIMLEARIIAVADVVESMVSMRPYRAAPGLDQALAEIRDGAGVRYDADVVAACEAIVARHGGQLPSSGVSD